MIRHIDRTRFFNACMSLMNIDMDELVKAAVIAPGNYDNGGTSFERLQDDPLIFLAKLDDPKRDALWELIEARQRVESPLDQALQLLCKCFDALDGEEGSVKDEHESLIADVGAFIEGTVKQEASP